MFGIQGRTLIGRLVAGGLSLVLMMILTGCALPKLSGGSLPDFGLDIPMIGGGSDLQEVEAPPVIQKLGEALARYQPQVTIQSPRADEFIESDTVEVSLKVEDLPLFKDKTWELGPHVHLFIDDQPYQAVYDASAPVTLKGLTPGTHTIRAFASRPWHESFKNPGAYDQVTFHVFTQTEGDRPTPNQPLLTYSRPQATYGAEPIMLDFYLQDPRANGMAAPPQVKVTINGTSFVMDRWEPIYLKGFKEGQNWLKVELLNSSGQPLTGPFSSQTRLITFKPDGQDTLSKLVRGEVSVDDVGPIVGLPPKPAPAPPPSPAIAPTTPPSKTTSLTPEAPTGRGAAPMAIPSPPPPPSPVPRAPVIPSPSPIPVKPVPAKPAPVKPTPVNTVPSKPNAVKPLLPEKSVFQKPESVQPEPLTLQPVKPAPGNTGLGVSTPPAATPPAARSGGSSSIRSGAASVNSVPNSGPSPTPLGQPPVAPSAPVVGKRRSLADLQPNAGKQQFGLQAGQGSVPGLPSTVENSTVQKAVTTQNSDGAKESGPGDETERFQWRDRLQSALKPLKELTKPLAKEQAQSKVNAPLETSVP